MDYIGITERGDAALDLSWINKLDRVAFAVLITKRITPQFIEACLEHKEKLIVHATITGYGGTILEPNVLPPGYQIDGIEQLITKGFPSKQIVCRIDPIIPTVKGIDKVKNVLDLISAWQKGTRSVNECSVPMRIRVSLLDLYPHVLTRFKQAGLGNPQDKEIEKPWETLRPLFASYPDFSFESCAEIGSGIQRGCISELDAGILGLNVSLNGSSGQRKGCLCPRNKYELLGNRKRCPHGCLYCYWHN